eukprot:Skav200134  [mRNA]  locus=scaffold4172:222497:227472:- [translate_table: standard]
MGWAHAPRVTHGHRFAEVLEAGADNLERRKILAEAAQARSGMAVDRAVSRCWMWELTWVDYGQTIRLARAAGVTVLPVARTGGASATDYESWRRRDFTVN